MDSTDVVDDINALLKLGVGDSYRLEHIKQAYIQNKTVWITDNNYLLQLKAKYLTKHVPDEQAETDEIPEADSDVDMIHCWKCGKKSSLDANFCMICGSSLFEVGPESDLKEKLPPSDSKNGIGWKVPVLVVVFTLILLVGIGYSQGFLDDALERKTVVDSKIPIGTDNKTSSGQSNSRCGVGTVFDSAINSCVLEN